MFGYILAYVGGVATGVTLIYLNRKSVEAAVSECKKNFEKERQKLIDENKRTNEALFRRCNDDAFRQGFEQGRLDPYDEAERFAMAMSGKQNITFRTRNITEQEKKAT